MSLMAHNHPLDLVDELDDDELYLELRKFNPTVGPVVDSTRGLYRKLLRRSLDSSPSAVAAAVPLPDDEEFEELNQTTEVGEDALAATGSGKKSPRNKSARTRNTPGSESPIVTPSTKLTHRSHGKQVSFSEEVEWVQNDPDDVNVKTGWSFFCKAVVVMAFISFVAVLLIGFGASYINQLDDATPSNPQRFKFESPDDQPDGEIPGEQI